MTSVDHPALAEAVERLRVAGAVFAFVHGSRARGDHRPDSDLDVAAWWGTEPAPAPFDTSDLAVFVRAVTRWVTA